MTYEEKKFDLPALDGISEKQIEVHLGLYAGYVKHVNLIRERIGELSHDTEKNGYAIAEMQRRLGFEFGGMRNHEYYFGQLERGAKEPSSESELMKSIMQEWGSFDDWLARFKHIAGTRGVGWAMLYFDREHGRLVQTWVDEQHIGQLAGLDIILGIDMWEHAFMVDYMPSEKTKYIDAFFKNLNWGVMEKRFADASANR